MSDEISDIYVIDCLLKQLHYEQVYGNKTIVFFETGTTYNCLEYCPQDCETEDDKRDAHKKYWDKPMGKVHELKDIMECVQTSRNKNCRHSIKNPYMLGFNTNSYEKHSKRATRAGYVVVRMDEKPNPNPNIKTKIRVEAEVINPTTNLELTTSEVISKNIMVIYIEYQSVRGYVHHNLPQNFFVTSGVATLDLITGKAVTADFFNSKEDRAICLERLYQFLIAHQPCELIIHLNDFPEELVDSYSDYIKTQLELVRYERVVIRKNDVSPEYSKNHYQIQFFNKLFNAPAQSGNVLQVRNDRIVEHLGLENIPYGRLAYVLLMNHQSYNLNVTTKPAIPTPVWLDEATRLVLSHSALTHLGIIPMQEEVAKCKETDSLFSVMDHNCTNLGRRLLRDLLIMPMIQPSEINKYYAMTDEALTHTVGDVPLYVFLDRKLKALPDLERLFRKMRNHSLQPRELASLYRALELVVEIYCAIVASGSTILSENIVTDESIQQFNRFLDEYQEILSLEAIAKCRVLWLDDATKILEFQECPFKTGKYSEIDQVYQRYTSAEVKLNKIAEHLNTFLGGRNKKLVVSKAKKKPGKKGLEDPTVLMITATDAKSKKILSADYDRALCGTLRAVKHNSTEKLLTSEIMESLYSDASNLKLQLRKLLYEAYACLIIEMNGRYNFYDQITLLVSKVDLIHSYAKTAKIYGYHRPVVDEDESKHSYLECTSLRHPISERIITGEFVTNEIFLGVSSDHPEKTGGIVIKGQNGAGKTTLTKSVALNIVMAQCGSYTSSYLKYKPYKKIFTRLSTNDNLAKNQSSFMVEMSELITIIRQFNEDSLCIMDEITRGSDFQSGYSITSAAIESLVESKASFLLATHIHNLSDSPEINKMGVQDLKICHLSLYRDEKTGLIVHDRKLKNGDGTSCYGIMVAESMGMPAKFIERAYKVLNFIQNNDGVITVKKSNFNKKVYVDSCIHCGSKDNLETHHLKPQSSADENKLIGAMHMNTIDNLVPICDKCHRGEGGIHQDGIKIKAVETLGGTAFVVD